MSVWSFLCRLRVWFRTILLILLYLSKIAGFLVFIKLFQVCFLSLIIFLRSTLDPHYGYELLVSKHSNSECFFNLFQYEEILSAQQFQQLWSDSKCSIKWFEVSHQLWRDAQCLNKSIAAHSKGVSYKHIATLTGHNCHNETRCVPLIWIITEQNTLHYYNTLTCSGHYYPFRNHGRRIYPALVIIRIGRARLRCILLIPGIRNNSIFGIPSLCKIEWSWVPHGLLLSWFFSVCSGLEHSCSLSLRGVVLLSRRLFTGDSVRVAKKNRKL